MINPKILKFKSMNRQSKTQKIVSPTIQIPIIKNKDKIFVDPKLLKANPLNTEIYTNIEEEKETQLKLSEDFKRRVDKGQCPNEQPVVIWSDGLIDAGHTRTEAAKLANTNIWVVLSDKPYPDFENEPYTTLQSVVSSNIYRKMTHSVKLNEFEQMNKAYVKEFGINRTSSQEDEHIKQLGTSRDTIKKLQEIKLHRKDLLPLVDSGEMSVKTAWEEATGKNKAKVVKSNNPNRDWSEIYTTDIFKTVFNRVSNTIHSTLESKVVINGEDYFPYKDFTKGAIAAMISHLTETIGAQVLKSEGYNVRPASGHPTDPDIYHVDIDDKVEIKVTNFNSSATSWKGGMGIREGQYILVAYDETINRWLVIFTYLTEKDWKSAGIGGHTLPIKNVLDNHKKDMVVVYGDLYENNGKPVVQLDTLK
jgi:hypothetical protein